MADIDTVTDDEAEAEAAAASKGGGLVRKLIIGGGAVVLLGAGIVAGPALRNMINPPAEAPAAESAAVVEKPVAAVPGDGPEIYEALHPPLIVNFQDAVGDSHYMQITMEVMARDQEVIDAVKEHTAVIRNNLILLYGGVDYDDIRTRAGKEKMLAEGLSEIQAVLKRRIGKPGVEALYFTSLIIQ